MSLKISILCENTVIPFSLAIAEHGFSCFIETQNGNYLFDTGQGLGIRHNCFILKKDLPSIKAIIFSHGHYDHSGGFVEALKLSGPKPVYVHPDFFSTRYSVTNGKIKYLGLFAERKYLEYLGANFVFNTEMVEIQKGMYLTGEVPKLNDFENSGKNLVIYNDKGEFIRDPIKDDNTLVFDTEKGLVLLFGCAHAVLVNIMDYVTKKLNKNKIYAVIGGTHLKPATEYQFTKTIEALKKYDVQHIGVSHCTGLQKSGELAQIFKDKFFYANVGTEFIL